MKSIVFNPQYELYAKKDTAFCSSLQVAEEFGKRHDNVLKDIKMLDCSEEFTRLNFEASKYKDSTGRKLPMYYMTRDGFMFLVMGYRGKKAAAIKEAIIKRFNDMEEFIKRLAESRLMFPDFTEAIRNAHDEPQFYHFSNECDMINRIVLGMSAKQFRELHGLNKGDSIRPFITEEQVRDIHVLQNMDAALMDTDFTAEQRRELIAKYHAKKKARALQKAANSR